MLDALVATEPVRQVGNERHIRTKWVSLITSQPLKKARSSIGADCGSGLTRPLLWD